MPTSRLIDFVTSSVRARVPPPAPYVTETNAGASGRSFSTVSSSASMPARSLGGKNSNENAGLCDVNRSLIFTFVRYGSAQADSPHEVRALRAANYMLSMALLEKPAPVAATSAYHRVVAGSTIAVMLGTLASMVFGFAREVVNAQYFGEHWELDAFLVAAIIPTLVFGVFNGSLVTALVPVFSGYFANDEPEEAWRLSSTVINVLLIVLSLCALVGWLAAPCIVRVVATGFPPNEADVTTHMTRVMMPTIIATSIAGVVQALLNAQRRYKAASLQGMALNVCAIAGVLVLFRYYGIFGLVFGTAIGAVAQLVIQLPGYFYRCRYRFVIDLHHPGLRHLFAILGPIVIGSAVGQVNLLFDKYFASTLQPGNIAAMQYATKVVGFPQQLFEI